MALTAWLGACSDEPSPNLGRLTESILGGTAASTQEYPATAAIVVNGSALCGGVLITPRMILSAAHCFDPAALSLADLAAVARVTRVHFGAANANALAGPGAEVADIRLEPLGASMFTPIDLSLLELKTASSVVPALVNTDPARVPQGVSLTLVGYGASRTLDGAPDPSSKGVLRSVTASSRSCAAFANRDRILCFDLSTKMGPCEDDGGPSFVDVAGSRLVAGIHSRNDAACSQYAIDIRVDTELAFIGPALCAADGYCAPGCSTRSVESDPDCTMPRDAGLDAAGHAGESGSGGSGAIREAGAMGGSGPTGSPGSGATGNATGGTGGTAPPGIAGDTATNTGGVPSIASGGMATGNGGSRHGACNESESCNGEGAGGGSDGCGCRLATSSRTAGGRLVAGLALLVSRRRRRR